jgi:hypothetical protein
MQMQSSVEAVRLINCLLPDAIVSFPFGNTAAMRSRYSGQAVEIRTRQGAVIRVTIGHLLPVAPDVSLRAGQIKAGDVLYRQLHDCYSESAESLFGASTENEEFIHVRALAKPHYFHGEGARMTGSVDMTILNPRQHFVNLENTLHRKPIGLSKFIRHFPHDVVTSVETFPYEGYVYDFSGESLPFFAVDGVIVHNCRCHLDWRLFLDSKG